MKAALLACHVPPRVAESVTTCTERLARPLGAWAITPGNGEQAIRALASAYARVAIQRPYLDCMVWADAILGFLSPHEPGRSISSAKWAEVSANAAKVASLAPIPYRRLQLARRTIGPHGILGIFAEGSALTRLTPHDARYAVYTSQSFFDTTKAHRAASGIGLHDPLPARVRVREDGFVNFILADGHHRALILNGRDLPILLRPDPSITCEQHYSFRNYVREHWSKL